MCMATAADVHNATALGRRTQRGSGVLQWIKECVQHLLSGRVLVENGQCHFFCSGAFTSVPAVWFPNSFSLNENAALSTHSPCHDILTPPLMRQSPPQPHIGNQ